MVVTGPERHAGVEAWAISLNPDAGEPVWKLWVAEADGKPLELRHPGRGGKPAQVIRWEAYEVLRGDDASALATLEGAHPGARIEEDPAEVSAAAQRLGIAKPVSRRPSPSPPRARRK